MSHTSLKYGQENSWSLGTCSNKSPHVSHKTAEATCCLAPGKYTLKCKDEFGDGWHGGFVSIEGTKFCEGFNKGKVEYHDITIPLIVIEEKQTGRKCFTSYYIEISLNMNNGNII